MSNTSTINNYFAEDRIKIKELFPNGEVIPLDSTTGESQGDIDWYTTKNYDIMYGTSPLCQVPTIIYTQFHSHFARHFNLNLEG
jgi:hypothetical protein